jgi:hypothetical protein
MRGGCLDVLQPTVRASVTLPSLVPPTGYPEPRLATKGLRRRHGYPAAVTRGTTADGVRQILNKTMTDKVANRSRKQGIEDLHSLATPLQRSS